MKVLNLRCARQHHFEGWFASEEDFLLQGERGQLCCPLCGDPAVHKMPTAPRLNLGHARGSADLAGDHQAAGGADLAEPVRESQGRLVQALRELMNATEDVGDRLADQVRAMHHGDLEQRNIRGRASPAVAQELLEEGIELLPLPALPPFKATLH